MREFWTFIGCIAVGILAVTGVYALDEDEKSSSIKHDEGEEAVLEDEVDEDADGDGV